MAEDELPIKTYSLCEVAAMVLPPDMKQPTRWLEERLRRGEISGYKIGRTWRMTLGDVHALIAQNRPASTPLVTSRADAWTLTPTSRQRTSAEARRRAQQD
jgi:hypothetical protein